MSKRITFQELNQRSKAFHGDKYVLIEETYLNMTTKMKIWCNKCQDYFWQVPSVHVRSGCLKCADKIRNDKKVSRSKREFKNNVYVKHGFQLDVSSFVYLGDGVKGLVKCKDHGEFWTTPSILLRGCGCPECGKIKRGIATCSRARKEFKSKVYKRFGDKYNLDKFDYISAITKGIAICKDHGEFLISPNALLLGNGCPDCYFSKGEELIQENLINTNTIFQRQVPLKRKNRYPLRFDFHLPDYDLYIEYQGQQHYKPIQFGGMFEEKAVKAYVLAQKNDQYKRDWCKKNSYKLLEIPYWDFDRIEEILKKSLSIDF